MIVYRVLPATNGHQGAYLTVQGGSVRLFEQRHDGQSWTWFCDTGRHTFMVPALPFDPAGAVDACTIAALYLGRLSPGELFQAIQ